MTTPASPVPPRTPFSVSDVPQLRDTGYGIPKTIAAPPPRIDSVDLLRGIVMVLMLLDHSRDFVHADRFAFDPTDPTRTTIALFFTRWITHFCAPVFVFLAGTSVYLQRVRGKSPEQLSPFLLSRGLWLIFLELTVVRLSIFYNADPRFFGFLQVIFAIGLGMIVLAALVRLPTVAAGAIGVGIIALHDLMDGIRATTWTGPPEPPPSLAQGLWHFFHQQGLIAPFGFPGPVAFVVYPVLPWIGVVAAGYAFGAFYEWDVSRRRTFFLRLGVALIAAFIALRTANIYGDPSAWTTQPTLTASILSFFNVSKYPPSLLYLLMTLGPSIALLGWMEKLKAPHFLVTFGRVPLFFYLLQWQYAHLVGIALVVATGGANVGFFFSSPIDQQSMPKPAGFNLWVVYAVWIVGVLLLYPACKWFAGVKERRKDWWLSYV